MLLKFTEAGIYPKYDVVYGQMNKRVIRKYFDKDLSVIGGEVQYIFNKDKSLNEILLLPIYIKGSEVVNRDPFKAPEEFDAYIEEARKYIAV